MVSERDCLLNAGEMSPASSHIIPGPNSEPPEQSFPKRDPRPPSESQMRVGDVS